MSSPAPALARVSYASYLALVFPFVVSTLTTPLLGAVMFSTLYWLFDFLRVSTTGFTAQALDDPRLLTSALFRPVRIWCWRCGLCADWKGACRVLPALR